MANAENLMGVGFSAVAATELASQIDAAGGEIPAGSIVNADISASAAIALSKLANVAAGSDGLQAGTLQATLQALATRIAALETP